MIASSRSTNRFRRVAQVGVHRHDVVTVRGGERGLERLAEAEVARMVDDAKIAVALGRGLGHFAGRVATAVVDDQDFETVAVLERAEVRHDRVQIAGQHRRFVVAG